MFYIYQINHSPMPSPFMAKCLTDGQQMHKFLCNLIHADRAGSNLLFRLDIQHMCLFVQCDVCPDSSPELTLLYTLDIDSILKRKEEQEEIHFQLTTDTRRKKTVNGKTKNAYVAKDDIIPWVVDKLHRNGLKASSVRITKKRNVSFSHEAKRGGNANITLYDFDIKGCITDAELFCRAWHSGMGGHKAYGNGLFVLCR